MEAALKGEHDAGTAAPEAGLRGDAETPWMRKAAIAFALLLYLSAPRIYLWLSGADINNAVEIEWLWTAVLLTGLIAAAEALSVAFLAPAAGCCSPASKASSYSGSSKRD